MFMTWAGWRLCTRLAVAGLTLGALIAAAPAVSASTLGLLAGRQRQRAGSGHRQWASSRLGQWGGR